MNLDKGRGFQLQIDHLHSKYENGQLTSGEIAWLFEQLDRIPVLEKIKQDHKRTAGELKRVKKKLKYKTHHTISLGSLETMLQHAKAEKLDYRNYYSWGQYNDDVFDRDNVRNEERVEFLTELIHQIKKT